MEYKMNFNVNKFVLLLLPLLNNVSGYGQDLIKLKTGQELQVSIHDKSAGRLSYYLADEDSSKLHVLGRNSIKWFRYEYLTRNRVSFSFSLGGIPYGTANSIKKHMRNQGYDGTGGIFGSTEYPVSAVKMPVLLELEFLMKPPHGISIEYGHSNQGSVQGYSGGVGGYTPMIHFNNPQLAFSYKLYSNNFKSALQAGVILNFVSIKEVEDVFPYKGNEVKDSNFRLGILAGYTGSLIEKRTFYMRFQTQLRFVMPVKFGDVDLFMYDEKISLSQFFIGIQMGFKLYP